MKFKVGDKVRGISDNYTMANKDMSLAEVVKLVKRPDIEHDRMEIKIMEHTEKMKIGLFLQVHNLDTEFELVEEKQMSKIEELEKQVELYVKNIESQQQSLETLKRELEQLKAEKENESWKPKDGDKYWLITNNGYVTQVRWLGEDLDDDIYAIGNVFRTKEEAEFRVEQLKVEAELRRFSIPFKECGNVYFPSKEIAQKAIDTVGEDRIKKYHFGVED